MSRLKDRRVQTAWNRSACLGAAFQDQRSNSRRHLLTFYPSVLGGTTFIDSEAFSGALIYPLKWTGNLDPEKTGVSFGEFDKELKKRVESLE